MIRGLITHLNDQSVTKDENGTQPISSTGARMREARNLTWTSALPAGNLVKLMGNGGQTIIKDPHSCR